jgi:hypothetical protein
MAINRAPERLPVGKGSVRRHKGGHRLSHFTTSRSAPSAFGTGSKSDENTLDRRGSDLRFRPRATAPLPPYLPCFVAVVRDDEEMVLVLLILSIISAVSAALWPDPPGGFYYKY